MPHATEREIHQLLLQVVRSLVDSPEEVEVELLPGKEGTVLRVEANPSDVGRLIGKGGQTARALQAMVNANAARSGSRFYIEIDRGPNSGYSN
jgi:hypothetical protein